MEMADDLMFSAEELRVDDGLGYPKAYAKLCRDRGFGPYSHGPPFTFTPFALQSHQVNLVCVLITNKSTLIRIF